MSKKGGAIKWILILAVLVVLVLSLGRISKFVDNFLQKINPFSTVTTVDDTGIAVNALNEIGEIITAQYYGETYCSGKANGHKNGIVCHQKNFSLFDVYGADEAFVTGTFGGLTPVNKIDGRAIGVESYGDFTRKLSVLYKELINNYVANAK